MNYIYLNFSASLADKCDAPSVWIRLMRYRIMLILKSLVVLYFEGKRISGLQCRKRQCFGGSTDAFLVCCSCKILFCQKTLFKKVADIPDLFISVRRFLALGYMNRRPEQVHPTVLIYWVLDVMLEN